MTDLDDRLVGTIVYFNVNYMDGFEIGYHLFDVAARNRGLMSEALRMAIDYLFAHHKINRLQIVTAPDNEPSKRLALKCGFRSKAPCAATSSTMAATATRCCTRCCAGEATPH